MRAMNNIEFFMDGVILSQVHYTVIKIEKQSSKFQIIRLLCSIIFYFQIPLTNNELRWLRNVPT